MTQNPLAAPPIPPAPKASGLAIASLVLGILGIIPPLGIIALILGLIALSSISKSAGRIGGKGLAVAGVALGAAGIAWMFLMVFLAALLLPAISKAREEARLIACRHQLEQISIALLTYQSEHNGQMPPDLTAPFESRPDLGDAEELLACPAIPPRQHNTGRNGDFSYFPLKEESGVPLPIAWDSTAAHGRPGVNVLFSDGHVEYVDCIDLASMLASAPDVYSSPPTAPLPPDDR